MTLRLPLLCLLACTVMQPADNAFDALVKRVERDTGVRRTHIPLMGFANFILKVAKPQGVSGLKLAVFEDLRGPAELTPDIDELVAAEGWRTFVKVQSAREATRIYARIQGKDMHLLLASLEPREAVVMEMKLRPDQVQKWLKDPIQNAFRTKSTRPRPLPQDDI